MLSVLEDAGNGGETDALLGQGLHARLDATTAGMGGAGQGQDLAFQGRRDRRCRWWGGGEGVEQSVLGAVAPRGAGGAGDAGGTAEGGDEPYSPA